MSFNRVDALLPNRRLRRGRSFVVSPAHQSPSRGNPPSPRSAASPRVPARDRRGGLFSHTEMRPMLDEPLNDFATQWAQAFLKASILASAAIWSAAYLVLFEA